MNANDSCFFDTVPFAIDMSLQHKVDSLRGHQAATTQGLADTELYTNVPVKDVDPIKFLEYIETSKSVANPIDIDLKDAKRRINAAKPKNKKTRGSNKRRNLMNHELIFLGVDHCSPQPQNILNQYPVVLLHHHSSDPTLEIFDMTAFHTLPSPIFKKDQTYNPDL